MDARHGATSPTRGDHPQDAETQLQHHERIPEGCSDTLPSTATRQPLPERVFPIRSMVSVTSSPSSSVQSGSSSPTRGMRSYSIIDEHTWNEILSQNPARTRIGPDATPPPKSQETQDTPFRKQEGSSNVDHDHAEVFVTSRFQHVVTPSGHAILTGRGGEPIMACEDEPIHMPGAVQTFGALVAVREVSEGRFRIHVVSENSETLLGYSPTQLFALDSFCDILSEEQTDQFLDHVDFVRDETYDPCADGPDVFILSIADSSRGPVRFWCAMHANPANRDMIICEFELEDDRVNPPNISGSSSPLIPSDTLGVEPSAEAFAASTVNISQPLRVLRSARRRRGEEAAMQVFSIVSQVQDQLGQAQTLDVLLNTTVGLVKELTGFHRVMVYQFDSDWNGQVVAELVDPRMTKDLYKGLHFPASDIPKQARNLYQINRVRLLYDRDQLTSRLVCRSAEDLETPLDMTHAYLRAMSPIHIKYLANMEVRASMSISINDVNGLWGLISCHSYGTSGMRVSFPIRKMCRLIGDTLARNIERLSYASRLQARKLINTMPTHANPSGYIIASSDDLLKLFDADYAALSIRGETKLLGPSSDSHELLALVEFLKIRRHNSVLSSQNITKDFSDLHYAPGFKSISGLLYVPLAADGADFMVFFRRGRLTEIKWGGDPHEKRFDNGNLEPRKSFHVWKEVVLDQSREWTDSEIETAAILCLVYGKFIKVWRQNECSSQLTKLLLANSAHEVRTPLNAVINYLEIALEGALDDETRENLTKSYSASKSLIYVINDLLDLTNTEKGKELIKNEPFDLPRTFKEATDMFEGESKRKGIKYTVISHPGVPTIVVGDQRRVRQALSNLISNAVQHTSSGEVTVEMASSHQEGDVRTAIVEMTVLDTGSGMSHDTLEVLFRELEQVSGDEDEIALRNMVDTEGKTVLGLGLALVSRIVHNRHGQLSVKSEEGKGSRFKISLLFALPDDPTFEEGPDSSANPEPPLPRGEEFVLVGSPPGEEQNLRGEREAADKEKGVNKPNSETFLSSSSTDDSRNVNKSATTDETPAKTPSKTIDKPSNTSPATSAELNPTAPPSVPNPPKLPPTYRVLVAEDDPINGKIVQKRLGKLGHTVCLTVNGEECAAAYRANPAEYDVVLMDIQMPLVDGMSSTRMIRQFETESSSKNLSHIAELNGRVPIFAVSASLLEKDAALYMDTGFDGWIMKPINFNRLNTVLDGLQNAETRNGCAYQPGQWENGGWFTTRTE
ncbi:GAF domain-like protein [Aspergillus ambiguus]|uniref:putative sensor histidine kinase/response regulator n=1 Tax=Aspergillus ambiguus TaxID=176160 RepID=UPI003CCCBC41